jgi:hypothetical protein
MICRSLLRLIAVPTIVVFVLFLVIQPEAIDARGGGGGERGGGGGARGGGGGYSREGAASAGGVRLAKRRRKALAPQASKAEAVTRRTGRAVPARTRLSANKPNKTLPARTRLSANKPSKTLPARIRLSANKPSKTKRIRASRMPTAGSRVVKIMDRTRSRVVRIMGRTRSRIARILQLTTDLPSPVVPGLAVVRLVIGAVTMLEWRPSPGPGWRWVQQSRAFLCNQRPL